MHALGQGISSTKSVALTEVFELLVQGQEQYDLAITGKQDAKTTLDNIAAFQEKLLNEAGHIQE